MVREVDRCLTSEVGVARVVLCIFPLSSSASPETQVLGLTCTPCTVFLLILGGLIIRLCDLRHETYSKDSRRN